PDIKVQITYLDYADTREVDAKLIKAAREIDAKLITNDFNLNKVAELQGVEVLNLNSLTNALKPVVLPGEDILIDIIKEGKDENQGIGYLEDGTMVVVENGGALLGKAVKVNVTSIIQTAAGKMIFTRAQGDDDSDDRNDQSSDRRDRNEEGGNKRRNRGRRGGGGGNNNDDRRGDREQSDGDREAVGGGRRRR
ncbi:MAG: TRAM domain-containing protein, partial [Leptospiraceae bacterium]|nr:TRAM domain-containing protein [Leptospiraceae bacterium]